eukprot:CAMPEP_0176317560 /NCGR_PEP_ID=MMETSP0121_2-20121125/69314_1 /TAXON_ID=160619 /ORGANISM="Kryptoperidinium foliaceum, Strain CCMP 1326" /LENGTH=166 /DNA_ID=CAMNT_0017659811 /DNA_START=12 /DNA_END=512 /DNA_ORIENTATION=-
MSPTLNPQESIIDRFFSDRVVVIRNAGFQKGDVVVLRDPNSNLRIVKRITAQGNEFVRGEDGRFRHIPPGHCWVEGDNPALSVDSRKFNAVPMGLLDGLVIAVIWPFWRARWLDIVEEPELVPVQTQLLTTSGGDEALEDVGRVAAGGPQCSVVGPEMPSEDEGVE